MKAGELVEILKDMIVKHGDLDVSCDTQDGGSYNVGRVEVVKWIAKDRSVHMGFEIS